jgi:hypothetical protein
LRQTQLRFAGIARPIAQTERSLGFCFALRVADEQQIRFAHGPAA